MTEQHIDLSNETIVHLIQRSGLTETRVTQLRDLVKSERRATHRDVADMKRLADAYTAEIGATGETITSLQASIDAMKKPFVMDIPKDFTPLPFSHFQTHWPEFLVSLTATLGYPDQAHLEQEIETLEALGLLLFASHTPTKQPAALSAPEVEFYGDAGMYRLAEAVIGFFRTSGPIDALSGLSVENYEVDDPTIKATVKAIGAKIGGALPDGWGFNLMLFEFGDSGSMFYVSSADRKDVAKVMREWIKKQGLEV